MDFDRHSSSRGNNFIDFMAVGYTLILIGALGYGLGYFCARSFNHSSAESQTDSSSFREKISHNSLDDFVN